MSELKTYKMVDEEYCTDCVCVIPSEVYLKSEADAVIAEKDKVISEKDEEIRRLHKALFKTCANWAWAEHVRYVDISDGSQGYKQVQERWEKMASKCIKKAREYK